MPLPEFLPPDTESFFPDLRDSGYQVTSEEDDVYNCVSWALDETLKDRWIDPTSAKGTQWPEEVPKGRTPEHFVTLFEKLGNYSVCPSGDFEAGFDKIVIYSNSSNEFTHVARRLDSAKWTSKLGPLEDISHVKVEGLDGAEYGTAKYFMKRPSSSSPI